MRSQLNQCLALFYMRVLLKLRRPLLLFVTLFMCALISLVFPQDKLTLTSGFLTLLYSFWAWECVVIYNFIHEKQNRFKYNLLYNGASIFCYNFTFVFIEVIICLMICGLGQILHMLDHMYYYPFYFTYVSQFELLYSEIAYGMVFLSQAVLISQFIQDEYSSIMVTLWCQTLHFVVFPTKDISSQNDTDNRYFYFGQNYVLPSVQNYMLAYALAVVFFTSFCVHNHFKYSQKTFRKSESKVRSAQTSESYMIEDELDSIQNEGVLKIIDVTKLYGKFRALNNISV